MAEGADVVLINEDKGNFVPMFLFQCEDISFKLASGQNEEEQSKGALDTQLSVHYFNKKKGYWEPAVERFSVAVEFGKVEKVSSNSVKLLEPLNINVSINLGSVVHDLLKLWEKSKKKARVF